jgi:PAS domain S-box-containing protein
MNKPQIRLLIVEDDLVDRMACRRALALNQDYEFVLSEAETGQHGLQLAHALKPDCILLDYHLPDLNGLEFLAKLRNDLGEIPVPVIMLTGADSALVAVEAMKRGAQDYLVKDLNRDYLELLPAVIQRALRERRTLMEKKQVEENLVQAEADLRKSREQLLFFIQHAPISMAMFDQDMNYLATSGRWLIEFGRGCVDLIGRNYYEAQPDIPAEWKSVHQQALAGAFIQNNEDMWIQGDGSKHWLRWSVRPWVGEKDKIGGIIISAEEITAQKLMENEILERRKKMEHLQTIYIATQTASAIAHEINQPLMAIACNSQAALMIMKSQNPNYDEICNGLERSEQQALRAGKSIRDLINYLSCREFPVEPLDLNQEIRDIVDIAKLEHNLVFHSILNLEEKTPYIQANRNHVHKVLLNLIHNGIDAMEASGVSQPAITVTVRTMKEENFAQVSVQDNGPGIKREDFQRLFEPFYTTKKTGIGMGLAISRSLIKENGGQLWIDPQESQGATFYLTLPFAT